MARLYANENFPHPVVDVLRRLGHDVVTIQEADRGSGPAATGSATTSPSSSRTR
jgi:hypothetical protein